MPKSISNCNADLPFPFGFHRRPINAPKMSVSISLKRFKNEARRKSMRDPSLNNTLWLQMAHQAPDGAYEAGITVVPAFETCWSGPNPSLLHFAHHRGP